MSVIKIKKWPPECKCRALLSVILVICVCKVASTPSGVWARSGERQRPRDGDPCFCARLPVSPWRRHTLLLDGWSGYSAGLAASSRERTQALCGGMSWTRWKGRSSEAERAEKRRGGKRHESVWRGKEAARLARVDRTTSTQARRALSRPHPPLSPQPGEGVGREYLLFVGWGSRWTAWVKSWLQHHCQRERNRYLYLLLGHAELWRPRLQALGGAPWPIILLSPFCLSQKDIHTTRYFHWAFGLHTHWLHISPLSLDVWVRHRWCSLAGTQTHISHVYTQRSRIMSFVSQWGFLFRKEHYNTQNAEWDIRIRISFCLLTGYIWGILLVILSVIKVHSSQRVYVKYKIKYTLFFVECTFLFNYIIIISRILKYWKMLEID